MRIVGLDVGDRRIGVAVSDALGLTAQPLTVLHRGRAEEDLIAICALIERQGAAAVVVGLPLTLRGERGPQAEKVVAFGQRLRRRLAVPVHFLDERLTTMQGSRALAELGMRHKQRKPVVDRVAAQLLLQQFLDMRRSREPSGTHKVGG
jgi:putative Holliday junction resolvase